MRIAFNARLLVGQSSTGVHLYTLQILRQLLQTTQHDFLLITDRKGPLPDLPRPVERVIAYPSARHPVLFYLWFEWAVPRVLRKWEADVFMSLDNFCSLRTEVPTILCVHDLAYLHQPEGVGKLMLAYYRAFMPKFVHRADTLVVVSRATLHDVVNSYHVDPKAIHVAYNGVRAKFAEQLSTTPNEKPARITTANGTTIDLTNPYIIYVGSIHPRKNVDGLIKAFNHFKATTQLPHKLVLVGRLAWKAGPTKETLELSPWRDSIVLTGYLEAENLGRLVAAATALILVSYFEGFGVPIIEAFNCRVPVIVSNTSSLPEVAGPGGIFVEPNDTTAIANAMQKLAEQPELAESLGEAGYAHAQQFTWEAAGAVYQRLLQQYGEAIG